MMPGEWATTPNPRTPDKLTRLAAARAADKLLKATGYDTCGKSLRRTMENKRKVANAAK